MVNGGALEDTTKLYPHLLGSQVYARAECNNNYWLLLCQCRIRGGARLKEECNTSSCWFDSMGNAGGFSSVGPSTPVGSISKHDNHGNLQGPYDEQLQELAKTFDGK